MSDTKDRSKYIRTYAKDVALLSGVPEGKAPIPKADLMPETHGAPSPWEKPTPTGEVEPVKAPEPVVKDERKETLNRLRAKVTERPPEPPPPLPPPPPPPPPAIPPLTKKDAGPSPLHTYTSDFSDEIDAKQASAFSVLAADADSGHAVRESVRTRSVAMIAGAIALFIIGGVGIAGAYWYMLKLSATPLAPLPIPSLVFKDESVELTGSGRELMQALADTAAEPLVDGNILVTYLSEATTTSDGKPLEIPLAGGALIKALELPAPDIFLRNISPASTVGIIAAGVETRPFFVFRITSYERTFAGMLAWEDTIGRDLALLYPPRDAFGVNGEASSINLGSSTPAAAEPAQILPYFADAVVASRDVRVLKDTAGNTIMLYGYADKATLILARDAAAFTALLSRLRGATSASN